ncbi:hypothetical protein DCAR_0518934 [Daucus carota subsp. sativus]|uniref:Thioredoxin domain-containing protein n=1 Tax=Daucus carota subsp. sativus TaxID=79200 RepID=A0AAF0X339_DAUCS|nr:PREDICTED: thioredoxin-like 1-2, chloroplastic [Daucus carota subsp. sativus]WOG99581.1 hypothetical protein DCAR_0518934 [Daucus carota subsp. sativus]
MACSLKMNVLTCCSNENNFKTWPFTPCPTNLRDSKFMGKCIGFSTDHTSFSNDNVKAPRNFSVRAQASICVSRSMRWWEKTLKPNMIEIHSGQQLVETLSNAGDRLVIVDFYSPGCGGCKALHPKICQLAELNSDAIFLKVNYEEHKKMCQALHIHVLPFFRFYRGDIGKLCSFSCTNATIKKFKDALAKYGTDLSCAGPAKGLDESELMRLASLGEISFDSPMLPSTSEELRMEDLVLSAFA